MRSVRGSDAGVAGADGAQMGEVIDLEARRRARDEARQRRDQALRRAESRVRDDGAAVPGGEAAPLAPQAGTPQEEPPETPTGPGRGGTGAG